MAKTVGLSPKAKVAKAILLSLAVGGFIAFALVVPNALKSLAPLIKSKKSLYNRRYYVNSTINRLVKQGFIEFKIGATGRKFARLTKAGKKELIRCRLEELTINRPLRWDGYWRVITFDIREAKRGGRDRLRSELRSLGFVRLQNSVWVYPYKCDEFVTLLKTYYSLGRSVLYLTVKELEDDSWLRETFDL